jgi:hypothetical protein
MVRFDNMMEKVPAKSTTLVCLHEMSATYGDEEFKSWHFFDTADLQGYVEWLDAPAEAAEVVKLVKPSTKKTAH